jgi:hypothetical protein
VISVPRSLARRFRAVLRRCLTDQQPRGSWPLLLCRSGDKGLVLQACLGDLALRYRLDGARPEESIAFRADALAEFEGRRDDTVELEQVSFGKGQARWSEGDEPRVVDLETVAPESVPEIPALGKQFYPMPAEFLRALDDAAKTTARESVRLALARIQVRGKTGDIVATDGRQLLVQGGFTFPWRDAVLVHRVPAFGMRELDTEAGAAVGRTRTHVAVKVGPWTFALAIDDKSRFPDVDTVIPRPSTRASRLRLDPEDAKLLAADLPQLPAGDAENGPVTLDLHGTVALRGRDEKHGVGELLLARSTASGPPVRVCTDRRYLLRAVKLGFDTVEVAGPDKPLVCRDDRRVYVWMPLDQASAIPAGNGVRPTRAEESPPSPIALEPERRDQPMPVPPTNGDPADHSPVAGSAEPERWGIAEVIAESETLRQLLQHASARAARLLAALKHQRRRSRAVHQAMQSLKQFQLDH